MNVQRIELSDDVGNRVRISPHPFGLFSLQFNCAEMNTGQMQEVLISLGMLRQLSRMLKFLETTTTG